MRPTRVDKLADYALRQIEKDKAIIVAPLSARADYEDFLKLNRPQE